MSDLMKEHDPEVIVLMETKIPLYNMGKYFEQFGLIDSSYSDPSGRVKRIWVLWNPSRVNMKDLYISSQCVHVIVKKKIIMKIG